MSNMNYDRDRYGPEYGDWERAPDRDWERNRRVDRGTYASDREGGYGRYREEPYRGGRRSDQGSDYVYSQGQGTQGNQYGQPSPYDQSGRWSGQQGQYGQPYGRYYDESEQSRRWAPEQPEPYRQRGSRYGQPEQYGQQAGYREAGEYRDRTREDERYVGPRGVAGWEGGGFQEAWQVPGPYTGRGPRDYRRSDERIREDILDRLTQHGQIDASDIGVHVSAGDVTLTGSVGTRQEKRLAEDVAESVSGVRDIQNQIKVRQGIFSQIKDALTPDTPESQPTDQQTRTH